MSNYNNTEETMTLNKKTGSLLAYGYNGTNPLISQLQKVLNYLEKRKKRGTNSNPRRALLGELQLLEQSGEQSVWRFTAVNGERFRIPEPENGIEELFDCNFVRKDGK